MNKWLYIYPVAAVFYIALGFIVDGMIGIIIQVILTIPLTILVWRWGGAMADRHFDRTPPDEQGGKT